MVNPYHGVIEHFDYSRGHRSTVPAASFLVQFKVAKSLRLFAVLPRHLAWDLSVTIIYLLIICSASVYDT